MARTDRVIRASPERVFEVLADPRGYAYWVLGSIEVRDADPSWPAPGARFYHTVGAGPLRLKDHTQVEEVEPARFLQIQAKARPLGKARVKLILDPVTEGTRVTMIEDAANAATALLFNPVNQYLVRRRNVRSLERLAELAEGKVPIPGREEGAPVRTPYGSGAVENPLARKRREPSLSHAVTAAHGLAAGAIGAGAMAVSTNAALSRARGRWGSRRRAALGAVHFALGIPLGAAHGLARRAGVPAVPAAGALFVASAAPPAIAARGLLGTVTLHHAVYALATSCAYELYAARRRS